MSGLRHSQDRAITQKGRYRETWRWRGGGAGCWGWGVISGWRATAGWGQLLDQQYAASSPVVLFIWVGWADGCNTPSLIVSGCHLRCDAAALVGRLRHKTAPSFSPSRLIDRLLQAEWQRLQGLYSGGEGG